MVNLALLFRLRCARRLKGCGHVDNASAVPTCPQPQQQTQKHINAGSRNKRSLAARIPGKHVKPPTDSAEEAFFLRTQKNRSAIGTIPERIARASAAAYPCEFAKATFTAARSNKSPAPHQPVEGYDGHPGAAVLQQSGQAGPWRRAGH